MADRLGEKERFVQGFVRRITSGELQPGTRLPPESEIAEQYGLAKTNVHLGMKELERLGFLKVVPRHATYIADPWEHLTLEGVDAVFQYTESLPDRRAAEALLELREMMGMGVIRWMVRRPNRTHAACVKERCDALEAAVPQGHDAIYAALVALYRVIYLDSGNAIFCLFMRSFSHTIPLSAQRLARHADIGEMLSVYRSVLQHIEKGDSFAAVSVWSAWNNRLSVRMLEKAFPESR